MDQDFLGGLEPSNGDHEIKRTGSTSSNYSNINANLHARVKAFQEQRQLKRNGSVGSGHGSVSSQSGKTEGGGEPQNIDKIVNKPLPPLPPSKESGQVLSPIRRAPRPPALSAAGPGGGAAKPSLSARRGLKLPAGGMSLKMKPPAPQEFAGALRIAIRLSPPPAWRQRRTGAAVIPGRSSTACKQRRRLPGSRGTLKEPRHLSSSSSNSKVAVVPTVYSQISRNMSTSSRIPEFRGKAVIELAGR